MINDIRKIVSKSYNIALYIYLGLLHNKWLDYAASAEPCLGQTSFNVACGAVFS